MDSTRTSVQMLIHPVSGHVQSELDWVREWEEMDPELWGGEEFSDAGLIPVGLVDGVWVQA